MPRFFLWGAWLGALTACSNKPGGFESGPAVPDASFVEPDTGGASGECTDDNKQIYVVTSASELYRFAPDTLTFTKVRDIDCGSLNSSPFSMAVDRFGMAWVLYGDGRLYQVGAQNRNVPCRETKFAPDQANFRKFGMAFVTKDASSSAETLFAADYDAKGLAQIDTGSLKLTFIGPFSSITAAGELTGRSDARMFAFFKDASGQPARIAEVEPLTARVTTVRTIPEVVVGRAWAFAHWGGDFWLFTAPSGSSQVTRYRYDENRSEVVKKDLGFAVVGAGVSTCAPLSSPR